MKNRIKYLDVAKFIGIFCIYLGHFGNYAGNAYYFVFAFHVPLFFFLSGCSEKLSVDIPLGKYIVKNIKSLLIPCYIFAIGSLFVVTVANGTYEDIIPNLLEILKGCIRNHYFAGGIWFLTCLFVMKIAFYVLKKVCKFKWLVLLLCVMLYCIAELLITPRPIVSPHMPYNIDSACYYIVFYALGYYGFEPLQSLLDWQKPVKKAISIGMGAVLSIYAAFLFLQKDLFAYIDTNAVMHLICPVLRPVFIILLVLMASKVMEKVKLFGWIGKNTLFLCGSEYVIKLVVPFCLRIVGLHISYPHPVVTYVYTFFLLVLCNITFVPLEKAVFKKMHLLK